MKKVFTILFAICFIQLNTAQTDETPKTEFTKMYLPVWQEAIEHCIDVAKAMPN